jgi:hypothetical protein
MAVREAMIAIAKTLLRLEVAEHGNNKGEVVSRLLQLQGGHDGDPWCAAFYSFAYELGHDLAGVPRPYNPGLSTSEIVRLGREHGKETTKPKGGDAVCFNGTAYGTGYVHTAMFNGWLVPGVSYQTIEGNVGDRVQAKIHNVTEPVTFISCE